MTPDPTRAWQTMTTIEVDTLAAKDPVIVLPIAAIEQHGPHLPLSTDLEIGLGVLAEAFRQLDSEAPIWTLPTQTIGTSIEHLGFAGTLSLDSELLVETIVQLGAGVARSGVRRLVISNSHGGNVPAMDTACLRLREEHALLVVKASYFLFAHPDNTGLPEFEWRHGLHGGAVETAMVLHLCPALVRTEALKQFPSLGQELTHTMRHVGPEHEASFAWLARDLNPEGVTGNAALANARLGESLVGHYGHILAEVIQDTRAFPLDRLR